MPQMYGGGWFFGMHFFWWIFWFLVLVLVFALLMPAARRNTREVKESPLTVLQRRYAAGEISTEEYEEKRKRLEPERGSSG